jgi:hypothetical protein
MLCAQSSPLIMRHADSLSVARTRGSLLLQGKVHFIHDSIQFKTQRAIWNRDIDMVSVMVAFYLLSLMALLKQVVVYTRRKIILPLRQGMWCAILKTRMLFWRAFNL